QLILLLQIFCCNNNIFYYENQFYRCFLFKKRGVLSMNSPGYRIKPYNKNKDLALRALEKESLYLPGLFGQWSVWERNIEKIVSTLGTVVQMGNIVGFNEDVKTHVEGSRSYNSVLVESILSNYLGLSNDGSKSNTVKDRKSTRLNSSHVSISY